MILIKYWIGLLLMVDCASAQIDSSQHFLDSKGTWPCPIGQVKWIEKIKDEDFEKTTGCFPITSTTFISDKRSEVKAVFDGFVCLISKVEDSWIIAISYGGYNIFYLGLDEPNVKVGQFINQGHKLGYTSINIDNEYSVEVSLLNRQSKAVNPSEWFIVKNCP